MRGTDNPARELARDVGILRALSRWNDGLNGELYRHRLRVLERRGGDAREFEEPLAAVDPSPITLNFYFTMLLVGWTNLAFPVVLLMICFSLAGQEVDGSAGRLFGLGVGLFPVVFCLLGGADVFWRRMLTKAAQARYEAANYRLDQPTRRLLRLSRLNDGTLVWQVALSMVVAITVAS